MCPTTATSMCSTQYVSVPALLALTLAYGAASALAFAAPVPWSLGAVGASVRANGWSITSSQRVSGSVAPPSTARARALA